MYEAYSYEEPGKNGFSARVVTRNGWVMHHGAILWQLVRRAHNTYTGGRQPPWR